MAKYRIFEKKITNGKGEVSYEYNIEKRYLGFLWLDVVTPTCFSLPGRIEYSIGSATMVFRTLEDCNQHLEKYFLNPFKEVYKDVQIKRRYHDTGFFTQDMYFILDAKGRHSFCYVEHAKSYIDKTITTTTSRVIY